MRPIHLIVLFTGIFWSVTAASDDEGLFPVLRRTSFISSSGLVPRQDICDPGYFSCNDGGCCPDGATCATVDGEQICQSTTPCVAPPVPCGITCCNAGSTCVTDGNQFRCQLSEDFSSSATAPAPAATQQPAPAATTVVTPIPVTTQEPAPAPTIGTVATSVGAPISAPAPAPAAASTNATAEATVTASAPVPTSAPAPASGLSHGVIGGIVGGFVGLLAIVGAFIFCWMRRYKSPQYHPDESIYRPKAQEQGFEIVEAGLSPRNADVPSARLRDDDP